MPNATFTPGYRHTSTVIDGAIIVICGDDFNGNISKEVWKSEDKGQSWTQMQDAPFSGY